MSEPVIQTLTDSALIEARAVRRSYRMGAVDIEVLRGVSIAVRAGETVSIMGASGSGKSTLLHLLGGLDRPTGGTVHFDGSDLGELSAGGLNELRGSSIGFVFQAYHLLPELNVLENVIIPAAARRGALMRMDAIKRRATELLERVGLSHRLLHRPVELSGGEQQRAAIARALINEPRLILADEPTGNLDSKTGEHVLECLMAFASESGRTMILVTHNDAIAARCDRRVTLLDGVLSA